MQRMLSTLFLMFILIIGIPSFVFSQAEDSVDVTFYYKPNGNPTVVYLPGEFNNWGNNVGGVISNPVFAMTKDPTTGIWSKTERLRIGGPNPLPNPTGGVPGAYQYKFNENGSTWLPDPLNPRQNPLDNNNSYLFIKNPTIHYLLPNSTVAVGVIRTRFPEITAYIFPSISSTVDTSSIIIKIDSVEYTQLGGFYDEAEKKLSFTPSDPLGDGEHQLILFTQSSTGSLNADTTTFTIQANIAQILSLPAETWKDQWRLRGAFFRPDGGYDSTVTLAQIIRPDTTWNISVTNGRVDTVLNLIEGDNVFQLQAMISGQPQISEPVIITRLVNHKPTAVIDINEAGMNLNILGTNSTDPDGQQLTYLWREDPSNPEVLGIGGMTVGSFNLTTPIEFGEYYVELTVGDPDGNLDSSRVFFTVQSDSPQVKVAGYSDNPSWLKNGRIYLMFIKAFTPVGTIQAAIPNLEYIKAMGFNIIWVLPVMEIPGNVDNQINIGYNIIDFMNVEQSYGNNQDFKDFVEAAHNQGLKVILDVTPNHTGRDHPFAQEALTYRFLSPYWYYYQTQFINHNTNGLGQCVTPQGIYYYCAFSDALLNYNWSDLDARIYMNDVYKYWVTEFGVDGYRFDVYWGPHRRYGEVNMGIPVRENLKHVKPDILLLGEDSGTGVGTEVIYADDGGGLDMAYDSKLYFNQIRDFSFTSSGVNGLHTELDNAGFYPGENSYYLRFMENQDEDRISYEYNSFEKTMPMATVVFTAPGVPLMYNGQEVGFGKGMGAPGEPDLNDRRRGIIDWNFSGRDLLQPHYQRLAQIRSQFKAFSQHRLDTNGDGQVNSSDESDFIRVSTDNGILYSFIRPYQDENGLTIANFSSNLQSGVLNLETAGLKFTDGLNPGTQYWVNDLYSDTSYQVLGSDLSSFSVTLPGYGSAIFVISDQQKSVNIPPLPALVSISETKNKISDFRLYQNYPNPFNPSTTVQFELPRLNKVNLVIFDLLGRKVKTLVNKSVAPGKYEVQWNGRNESGVPVSSGIYILHFRAGKFEQNRRIILLK